MRILLTTAAVAALLASAAPTISYAQDAEDAEILRQAKEHYRLGLEAFKNGKYTDAIKELKKAYLLKRLPPLLVNIAKTYEKLNDNDNAIYYYKKYLAEAPPDAKDRDQAKQALADIQAKKDQPPESRDPENLPEARGPGRSGDNGEEAPPPRRTTRLDLARQVDRPALQQQLFGQRGLARVRVRDDGEGAAIGHGGGA